MIKTRFLGNSGKISGIRFCISFFLSLFLASLIATNLMASFVYFWHGAPEFIFMLSIGSTFLYFGAAIVFFPITLLTYIPVYLTSFNEKHAYSIALIIGIISICYFITLYEERLVYSSDENLAQFLRTFSYFSFIGLSSGYIHSYILKAYINVK